ncbi:amino acid racemase [Ktedonosporobacter rubrisoli]|uniref:Amino acid racemase n=1 Tax=Ktedonosporobacter rubrisoli TaxID=2509675 RepID=A0A4P6JK91_KTERU|nr:amino acid racemase [Ktedonosporobacter rubrisoli]QBD75597.1 amino acid racemase [Ktedonosporobacter rubrisoli]
MKHLGILAHSIEGAVLCLRTFTQEGARQVGPHEHPDVTLDCISMARSMEAWEKADYAPIRAILAESALRLAKAGADFFVCPDNTAHIALEEPGPELALPGLHIARIVSEQAARNGYKRVGVLGTKYTMESSLYPRALGERGIDTAIPEPEERRVINEIIFAELVNGIFTDPSRQQYVHIIEELQARGCDAVALVCTEIPLLITPEVSPLPTLDSTRLLAYAAFEVASGQRSMPTWKGGNSQA